MVELFGARYTAGFKTDGHYFPSNNLFIQYPEGISEIHRHLLLMSHLQIAPNTDELEFPIDSRDEKDFIRASINVEPGKYICVHPGSREGWRQWPIEYFADLADECNNKGWKIVLTGVKEELPVINEVAKKMRSVPVIAAGKTNLGAFAVLLKNSAGLISNCTGVSHIASALKKRSVIISMDGEPERWGPINKKIHTTIDWKKNPDYEVVRHAVAERFS